MKNPWRLITIPILDKTNEKQVRLFNEFVLKNGDITQTTYWGNVKSNWQYEGVYLEKDGEIIAAMLLLLRQLPLLKTTLAYCSKGPACNVKDKKIFSALMQEAQPLVKKHRIFSVKLDPEVLCSKENKEYFENLGFKVKCGLAHLHDYAQPKFNMLLTNLSGKNEETILAELDRDTRYKIRKAERNGVTGYWENSPEAVKKFHELYKVTAIRDSFSYRGEDYFLNMLKALPQENLRFYFTRHEEDILSGAIAVKSGDKMWYMYGASSNEKRKLFPNYVMQWEMIKWALECGCNRYDFGGIFNIDDNDGLYRFKKGFCGEEGLLEYLGEIDMVYNRFSFFVYDKLLPFMQSTKRKLFKLMKK